MMINENVKVRLGYLGTMEGKGMYEKAQNNPDAIISIYEDNEPDGVATFDINREFFKVNKDVQSYYIYKRDDGVDVFLELPLVENTELFKWERRDWGRSKTLWTQIQKGSLRFNCAYYLDTKSIHINAMWDNANIKSIWIKYGTNDDILAAINDVILEVRSRIVYSTESAELKNAS